MQCLVMYMFQVSIHECEFNSFYSVSGSVVNDL